jgi:hypothetical protein
LNLLQRIAPGPTSRTIRQSKAIEGYPNAGKTATPRLILKRAIRVIIFNFLVKKTSHGA